MSRTAAIRKPFAGAMRRFALGIGEAMELQDMTGVGLTVTLDRVSNCAVVDAGHVLRLGLVGGGLAPDKAEEVVAKGLIAGEILQACIIAAAVVEAALRGAPDEPLGESCGGEQQDGETLDPPYQTAASDTPT